MFYADGRQGISDEDQQNYLGRITWQISPKHKFAAYYDRIYRFRGHSMGAGDDPDTAAIRWTTPTTYDGMAKLTSTLTSKLLFEVGFSAISTEFKTGHVNDSLDKVRGTPEWYATTRKQDLDLSTIWGAGTEGLIAPFRNHVNAAISYVSGRPQLQDRRAAVLGRVPPRRRLERRSHAALSLRRAHRTWSSRTRRAVRATSSTSISASTCRTPGA